MMGYRPPPLPPIPPGWNIEYWDGERYTTTEHALPKTRPQTIAEMVSALWSQIVFGAPRKPHMTWDDEE